MAIDISRHWPDPSPVTLAECSLVSNLRDRAAAWQQSRGIDQWHVGEVKLATFEAQVRAGTLFVVRRGSELIGSIRLQWSDIPTWGADPLDSAGYIHGLMTDLESPGLGAHMLAWAQRRIKDHGRTLSRLDCVASNYQLRE